MEQTARGPEALRELEETQIDPLEPMVLTVNIIGLVLVSSSTFRCKETFVQCIQSLSSC